MSQMQCTITSRYIFIVYLNSWIILVVSKYQIFTLGYADDILLCPTVEGLKIMIKICEEYANEHSIMFNGSKSKYLVFGNYKYNPTIHVNNENVSCCTSAMHFRNMLHTEKTEKKNYLIR